MLFFLIFQVSLPHSVYGRILLIMAFLPNFFFQTRKTFVLFSLQWRTLFFSWTWKSITLYSMHVVQRKSRKKKEDKEIFLKKKKVVFLFVNNTTTTTAIWWKKNSTIIMTTTKAKKTQRQYYKIFLDGTSEI